MNIHTGEIREPSEIAMLPEAERADWREMAVPPTADQRARRKVGRNHPCPCGSGRKFKACCLWRPDHGA